MKVCVIGVGRWGRNIARVLKELELSGEIDEVCVCDIDESRAREVSKSLHISRYFTKLDDALRYCEAFAVAVPTIYHFDIVSRALEFGDVFVEKPIAASCEEARKMLEKAEALGRVLMVGHIVRFEPAVTHLVTKLLPSLGEDIKSVFAERVGPGNIPGYTANLGVAHDLLIHDVDLANYILCNVPDAVYATCRYVTNFPYEVSVHAVYSYGDTVFVAHASWDTSPSLKIRLLTIRTYSHNIVVNHVTQRIVVEKGVSRYDSSSYYDILVRYGSVERTELSLLAQGEPLMREMRHFIKCVKERKTPLTNGWCGYIALKAVEAALRSAKEGCRVRIDWGELPDDPAKILRRTQ